MMRKLLLALATTASLIHAGAAMAQKNYGPGVTDTEIKLGQTIPYSGPASAYGTLGRTHVAFFKMINDQGGINGRKVNLISLDDGYSPPKTIEAVRRLVESEEVLALFGTLGTPTNSAIHKYVNQKKVPHLFVSTGAGKWNDPKNFPWTTGFQPNYPAEGKVFAAHILATKPDAKIAILYQNDDFGKDYLIGMKAGLGDKAKSMIVAEASFEVTDPTVDSQILSLRASGADVFINAAAPKGAAQAIKKIGEIGWKPVHYVTNVSATVGTVLRPAGLHHSTGLMTTQFQKDPGDSQWDKDPEMIAYKEFMKKYYPDGDVNDQLNLLCFASGHAMAHVLKQAGDNLTRENVMKIAGNLKDLRVPGLLPGLTMNTSPTNHGPLSMLQMARFDGTKWVPFGEPITAK
ncbi:MAG: ABC transporter substrate-binding protein [Gammaproteobacteria bacterium]|jgi:ABC-type branched-subunit amino acid transport system substrate-binding protein